MDLPVFVLGAVYIILVLLVYLAYNYRKNYTFWTNSGLPYIPFPRDCVFYPAHKSLTLQRFYNDLAPHPVGGMYKMSRPYLLIRDPVLVRHILIKDFAHFVDRGIKIDEKLDPLNLHIFNLEGDRWRNVRQKLTPVFSSGKLKGMLPYMAECKKVLTDYLDRLTETRDQIEVREVFQKFALDVIGTCAFGLKCDAIQNEECEFRKVTATILRPSYSFFFRSFLRSINSDLTFWMKWKRIDKTVDNFFFSMVDESTKLRAKDKDKRKDIMQQLINLRHEEQESLKEQNDKSEPLMTDSIVAAQAFVFFVAGFETTAATMGYVLYELALNPDIMTKCREEIKSVLQRHGETTTYESLKDLTYLQCVIDETMRRYPVLGWLERICVKSYQLPDSSYIVKKNTRILIPVYALHHDPKYFPDPYKFNPDRFSEEKQRIVPGTYLPFGDGPRICIGMRFAYMEMKATLATIIMKYNIEPTPKTDVPLRFSPTMILTAPTNGIWLRLKKVA